MKPRLPPLRPATDPRRARLRRAGRLVALLAVTTLLAAFAVDLSRPPSRQWSAAAAIAAIHVYQHRLSPLMSVFGASCRFRPTCSAYAEVVIRRDGLLKGGWRAFTRVVRCGPWTPAGTADPP